MVAARALPAWPLRVLLFGFPLFWIAGALPFVYMGIATLMVVLLVMRRSVSLVPGLLPYLAFVVWACASSVMVGSTGQMVGYLWRLGDLVALGVVMLYYASAREDLDIRTVVFGLTTVWATTVVLGVLATQLPDIRLTTPVGMLLPGAITSNDLVHDLVFPPLAEVQQPWGAPVPYNRPAAPFPYANSWGVAYVLLTPVAVAAIGMARRAAARVLLVVLLCVSVWPAIQTSNRGMFLGLAAVLAYVTVRLLLAGRLGQAMITIGVGVLGAIGLVASGAVAAILGRQEYSDSTGTRASIYRETFDATLASPLLGWANPRNDATIGVALGTQGYIWTLMYCFGFVGLALFLAFLAGSIVRTLRLGSVPDIWLHSVLIAALTIIPFYGLGTTQLFTIALVAVALLRRRAEQAPA